MNREVDTLTEEQRQRKQSRDTMLAVLERVSRLNAGGTRSPLPDAGTIPGSDVAYAPDFDVPIAAGVTDGRDYNADNRSGSHAWGGHANGHIPKEALTGIGNGQYLEAAAADAFARMKAAAAADGVTLRLSDAYRDYDTQVRLRQEKGHLVATATPGYSIHGWGHAIDVSGGDAQAWLRTNGAQYGWVWPSWAQQTGTKQYEPWHFEFVGGPAVTGNSSAEGGGAQTVSPSVSPPLPAAPPTTRPVTPQ